MVLLNQEKIDYRSKYSSDLYIRPSYYDASIALNQIDKGKAEGQRTALWFRSKIQKHLYNIGIFLHKYAGKVIFVALLILATLCVGLKNHIVYSKIEDLWIEEGGKLELEIKYTEKNLGELNDKTHQLFIQTPNHHSPTNNMLTTNAMMAHLNVLQAAINVEVNIFDTTWKLKDLCQGPSFPSFEHQYIDLMFERTLPCTIMTPLDCFWEGSKLLGPDDPVHVPKLDKYLKWTSLNPYSLVQNMKYVETESSFPFNMLEDHMNRAGIISGYQNKPCLNPKDPECPNTAPNKQSALIPNIGAELTGGCYGIAANYMHWHENLILGGIKRNRSGHIQKARSIQSVVQLLTPREVYDDHFNTFKVHNMDWSIEMASYVLEKWQLNFKEELIRAGTNYTYAYKMLPFSTSSLNDLLSEYAEFVGQKVLWAYAALMLYVVISLSKSEDPIRSQSGLGIFGCALFTLTVIAGLGFCSSLGIPFNLITIQAVPFISVGLTLDSMILITKCFSQYFSKNHKNAISLYDFSGLALRKIGIPAFLNQASRAIAFFAAALMPTPGLRMFHLQLAVAIFLNLGALLLVYPAMVSLDLRRTRAGRADMFCCCCCFPTWRGSITFFRCFTCTFLSVFGYPRSSPLAPNSGDTPLPTIVTTQPVANNVNSSSSNKKNCNKSSNNTIINNKQSERWVGNENQNKDGLLSEDVTSDEEEDEMDDTKWKIKTGSQISWRNISRQHAQFITKPIVKLFLMLVFIGILILSVYGNFHLSEGVHLPDLVPKVSSEHEFLEVQTKDFGFYNMFAVTKNNFDYPNKQKLLYDYHEAFMRVPNIVKTDDGGLPQNFWLILFRDWLLGVQESFDKDYAAGCITQEKWFPNASESSILAYKLLVQTGKVDNPVDKNLIKHNRLVNSDGIINAKAFYNYLSAWYSNDVLSYGYSQSSIRPDPKLWYHVANDFDLKIPKSAPITYAQIPFNLNNLYTSNDITSLIEQIRDLCSHFEAKGLPNFPNGIIFYFWQPLSEYKTFFSYSYLIALVAILLLHTPTLVNIQSIITIGLMLVLMTVQLGGFMHIMDIKFNCISSSFVVASLGMFVPYVSQITFSFLTSIGNRDRRVRLSLEHMYSTIFNSGIILLMSVTILAFSEFQFILNTVFYMFLGIVSVGFVNGLFFFPVLLSLIGPAAELIPLSRINRISTPSPEPIVKKPKHQNHRNSAPPPSKKQKYHPRRDPPSLTTISEEPSSWNSSYSHGGDPRTDFGSNTQITLEPELTISTTATFSSVPTTSTTTPNNTNINGAASTCSSNCDNQSTSSSSSSSTIPSDVHNSLSHQVTTTVTACTKFKLHLHSGSSSRRGEMNISHKV